MQHLRKRPAKLFDDSYKAVVELQCALDLDSIWKSCLKLVRNELPHRSCSLMFNIVGYEPTNAKHHVVSSRNPNYVPPTSLTISSPYLERHPEVKVYTYSQIVSEDPDAMRRRVEQEPYPEWDEFVHLAFWSNEQPEAVLSIQWSPEHPNISSEERAFLDYMYPMIDASLRRIRILEQEGARRLAYENLLYRMPVATLLVAQDGHQLFATAEGIKLSERWNRGLRDTADLKLALPLSFIRLIGIGSSTQAAIGKTLKLRHPRIKGLTATVERNVHTAALRERPCYVVTLADERSDDYDEPRASIPSSPEAWAALQKLSPTERRVALLVAKGLRNDEIAEHLFRSCRTIECQLSSIYRKLSLSRRTQLVRALS